jgi:hypothetical protein
MAWGGSYTNNSVYQYSDEVARQKAVVKKFIQDTPEYYQCDWNDKSMVDFIELSKKPFTTETINWAFQEVKHLLNPKPGTKWPKGWGQKVGSKITEAFSTSLNNSTTDSVQPAELSPASYMPVNIDGTDYQIMLKGLQAGLAAQQARIKPTATEVAATEWQKEISLEQKFKQKQALEDQALNNKIKRDIILAAYSGGETAPVVQSKPEAIAPLQTGRRIKDDDD